MDTAPVEARATGALILQLFMKAAFLAITLLAFTGCAQYRASYTKYAADGVTREAELVTRYNQFLWMSKAAAIESHTELTGEYSRTLLTKEVSSRSDNESIKEIKDGIASITKALAEGAVSGVVPVP